MTAIVANLNVVFSFWLNFTSSLNGFKKKAAMEYKKKIIARIIETEINGFMLKEPTRLRWTKWMRDLLPPQVGQGIPVIVLKGQKRGM